MSEFQPFPKIGRYSRQCIITEKIDGTNAQLFIDDNGVILAGSRNRYLDSENDNYGFHAWMMANREELLKLGPGRHFGEWWGSGINRAYGFKDGQRFFSLFNVSRWDRNVWNRNQDKLQQQSDAYAARKGLPPVTVKQSFVPPPACCRVVPVLGWGNFGDAIVNIAMDCIRSHGSFVVEGFPRPEGIVIYHEGNGSLFKKTIEKDDGGKSE